MRKKDEWGSKGNEERGMKKKDEWGRKGNE